MKKIIGIFLAMVLMASCRNKEQLGPDLKVTITQPLAVNTPAVDFAGGGKIFFTAAFENPTAWTITLTGANDAKKYITGVSKEINEANSSWTGTSDVLPSFASGSVTAELTFQVDPAKESVPFTITNKRVSDKPSDALVSNFVVNKRYYMSGPPPGGFKIGYTGPRGWPSDYPNISNTDMVYAQPDGDSYLIMSGIPWDNGTGNGITAYVNYLTIMADNSDFQYGQYFPLNSDPSNVYFNVMVLGTNTPYTWLQANIFEESSSGDVVTRTINLRPSWTGWKLLSYKYSDLAAGSAANSQKITGVQFVLLSDSPTLPGPEVKVGIDHVTFTNNAPYQP